MHRYRIALQRPSKLFDGMTGGLAPAIRSGMELAAGGGAACGDAACGNGAWDGAWPSSVWRLGLLAGAGTGFDVAPEGRAAVCVGAGLVFAVVGATAGAAVAAGWLPPMPNQLPIVCRVDVDSVGCTARVDAGTKAAVVISASDGCGGLTLAGHRPDGAFTSPAPVRETENGL